MVATAFAFALAAAPAPAAFPGTNGKIAFVRDARIWTMNADGSGAARLTNSTSEEWSPAWSPDGKKIAFYRGAPNGGIYVANADGSGEVRLTTHNTAGAFATWSPDGTQLVYAFGGLFVINADGTGQHSIAANSDDRAPAWSPDGGRIAIWIETYYFDDSGFDWYEEKLAALKPDGTGFTQLTFDMDPSQPNNDTEPNWSPDGSRIAFTWDRTFSPTNRCACSVIGTVAADGTDRQQLTGPPNPPQNGGNDSEPAWSPDGTKIVFTRYDATAGRRDLWIASASGGGEVRLTNDASSETQPDWQPIPVGYPRPKGATPVYISLVPAYAPCASSNRTHGAPLAFGSCAPPAQASSQLTVGTPDSNGVASVNSIGFVNLAVLVGNPATPEDESDVRVATRITDVRMRSDLSDYTGELAARLPLRITDKNNTGAGPATVADTAIAITMPCATTDATTVGSTCAVATTVEAVVPGSVKEGARSIWELGQIALDDGGPDGQAQTTGDNTLFAVEGVFVP